MICALVAVSDNGYGISPEDQERLFTRFYRVDNSMTREVGGTGLGLSIVKQLIELQGGEVGVQSAPGEGSTFYIYRAAGSHAETVAEPGRSRRCRARTVQPAKPAATILVVEDDPDIARLIAHHLQKAGYQVRVAHTAEEALAVSGGRSAGPDHAGHRPARHAGRRAGQKAPGRSAHARHPHPDALGFGGRCRHAI